MRVDDSVDNDVYWILKDHLNSTSVVLNDDGTVQSEKFYTAFGEERTGGGEIRTSRWEKRFRLCVVIA